MQYWFKYSEQLYRSFKKCFHHVHCGPHQLSWRSHHFMSPTVYLSPRWSFGSKSINNLLQLERLFIVIKLQILFYFADNQPYWASFLCMYHCSFSSSFRDPFIPSLQKEPDLIWRLDSPVLSWVLQVKFFSPGKPALHHVLSLVAGELLPCALMAICSGSTPSKTILAGVGLVILLKEPHA